MFNKREEEEEGGGAGFDSEKLQFIQTMENHNRFYSFMPAPLYAGESHHHVKTTIATNAR